MAPSSLSPRALQLRQDEALCCGPHPQGHTQQTCLGVEETVPAPGHLQHPNAVGQPHRTPPPACGGRDAARPGGQGSAPEAAPEGSGSRPLHRSPGPGLSCCGRRDGTVSPPHTAGARVEQLNTTHPWRAAPCLTCIFMPSRPSLGRKRARSGSEGRAGARRHPRPCPGDSRWLAAQGRQEAPSGTRSPSSPNRQFTTAPLPLSPRPSRWSLKQPCPSTGFPVLPSGVPRVCTLWWLLPRRWPLKPPPNTGPLSDM